MNSRTRYLWFRHAAVVAVAGACVVTIAMLGGGGSKLRLALEAVPMAMAMVGVAALCPLPRRPLRAAVAMLLLAPFAAFSILTFAGRPVLASIVVGVLPTDSLVAEVTGQESFTRDAWAELRTRELTVVQHAALVDGLCARDAAALHAGSDAAAWLAAEAAAGRLTSDQVLVPNDPALVDSDLIAEARLLDSSAPGGFTVTNAIEVWMHRRARQRPSVSSRPSVAQTPVAHRLHACATIGKPTRPGSGGSGTGSAAAPKPFATTTASGPSGRTSSVQPASGAAIACVARAATIGAFGVWAANDTANSAVSGRGHASASRRGGGEPQAVP